MTGPSSDWDTQGPPPQRWRIFWSEALDMWNVFFDELPTNIRHFSENKSTKHAI